MRTVKYIIDEAGRPILFSANILHIDMMISASSAGYAIITYDSLVDTFSVMCYGGSESLKVSIDEKDYLIIQDYLNNL